MDNIKQPTTVVIADEEGKIRPFSDIQKDIIIAAIDLCGGNMSKVAAQLGIGRSTLYRHLASYAEYPGIK